MCFSPEADFVAAAAVGVIGVATLREVRTRRELVIGVLPLLFALHQFVEGFVWLGARGQVPANLGHTAVDLYAVFAYAALPIIVPIGFWLLEPSATHRRWIVPFVALGGAVGLYLLWQVTQYPVRAVAHDDGIEYVTHIPAGYWVGVGYVTATCAPALLSSRRYLRWFGVINLVGVAIAVAVHQAELASVWCLYAALSSLLILEHFRRERRSERRIEAHRPATA